MGRYVTVVINTDGLYQVGARGYSDVGIVGGGVGAGFTVDTPYTINSPADAKVLFGETSALYQSILLLFSNGASKVIAVAADLEDQTPETFDGTGSQTEYTLSGIPAQPMGAVTIDAAPQYEGEDFYVDYGNGKVIFYVAPAVGTDNISITWSLHTLTFVNAALTVMESQNVQLMALAMVFETSLLSAFKTHCDAMKTVNARIGCFMLKNGETSTTLAATLASECSVLVAHKSLKDPSSGVCGKIASLRPWKDLTMKSIGDLVNAGNFSNSEQSAFDLAQIIHLFDPPKLTGTGVVVSLGTTLDDTGTLIFIDQVRVAHHLAGVLEFGLTNPNVIGEMKMNLNGLRELNAYISSLLNPWVKAGEIESFRIENPALVLFSIAEPTAEDISNMTALQTSRRLNGAYVVGVELVYAGTIIYIEINASLVGGV